MCPTKYVCLDDAFRVLCVLSPGPSRHSANCRWRPCIHPMQHPLQAAPGVQQGSLEEPKFKCHQGPLQEDKNAPEF